MYPSLTPSSHDIIGSYIFLITMASANSFFPSPPRCLVLLLASASFALLLHLPPSSASGTQQASEGKLVFHVSDLLPPLTCSPLKAMNPSKLPVVHPQSPCAPRVGGHPVPRPVHIFDGDQDRINWIQRRISTGAAGLNSLAGSESAVRLPATPGGSLGTGNYLVTVGFGTPRRDLTVVFDTGSDLSWIQCTPCNACYEQKEQLFDPRQSSTYANYSCASPECGELDQHTCSNSVCRYEVKYNDGFETIGNLSRDQLTLNSDVVPGFTFGCGDNNLGFFGRAAGLIGLGRGKVSLVSQLSPGYGSIFSYCLTSKANGTGYLAIGREATTPSNARYTPMLRQDSLPSFYFLDLTAIEVGRRRLQIKRTVFSAARTLVDSGTVITRLPPTAYAALRTAFRTAMKRHKGAPDLSILDTCYDFSGYSTVSVPSVALVFGGRARLNVDFSGILYVVNASQACLAFAGNSNASEVTIIGNLQQRTYGVIYDIQNSQIGFAPNSCP